MSAPTHERLRAAPMSAADDALLLRLLELPTAGPLEIGDTARVQLWAAGQLYAEAAHELGFTTVWHGAADSADVADEQVPVSVREAVTAGRDFLEVQPSLVLRLGGELPRDATVMFNVHLDTVAGQQPVFLAADRFHGRGAIDAKGPAVGLLAGIRAAIGAEPRIGRDVGVLIQAVAGEEGGAMGVFGTRALIRRGHVGRLNIFCEPTRRRLLTHCTAAMTARIRVTGTDAIDDAPGAGHNATVLLGHLAGHLARTLPAHAGDGQVCVAGLQTGPLHNKVYGSGQLLLNLSYRSAAAGAALADAVQLAFEAGLADFRETYRTSPIIGRTAADAVDITRLDWLKRGLPVLDATDPWAERLLTVDADLDRWPADEPAFTCDAIWAADRPGTFAAVYGPGDLELNHAHADGEFADRDDLQRFAGDIARLLIAFARTDPRESARNDPM